METPTGRSIRPTRTATPRLSERKKQLFRSRSCMLDQIDLDADGDDPLLGISPLKSRHHPKSKGNSGNTPNVRNLNADNADKQSHRMRLLRSSTSSSPETNKENKGASKTRGCGVSNATEEQLPHLFSTTMRIDSTSSTTTSLSSSPRTPKSKMNNMNLDSDESTNSRQGAKRSHKTADAKPVDTSPDSPQCKQRKLQKECIPTNAFYSQAKSTRPASRLSGAFQTPSLHKNQGQHQPVATPKAISPPTRPRLGINKGVRHRIRKPQRLWGGATNFDDILGSLRNEKLRQLIISKREERAKVEELHKTMRCAKNPIKMAKPLSTMIMDDANNNNNNNNMEDVGSMSPVANRSDFSDLSDEEELDIGLRSASSAMELEPVIPLIRHTAETSPKMDTEDLSKRKFFKSGSRSTTSMEVRITDKIRASVSNGKISLVEAPIKKRRKVRVKSSTIFSAEQATVDAILRNMDVTVVDEIVESEPQVQAVPDINVEQQIMPPDPYAKYHQQLPYQTTDPKLIEQQTILLEFLISNNICTDENFKIFITDPDNHQEEATRIIDNLYMVVNAEEQELEVPECDNAIVGMEASSTLAPIPEPALETEIVTTIAPVAEPALTTTETLATEKATVAEPAPAALFPIFTQRLQPLQKPSTRRKLDARARLMASACGSNQFQIDAGQKAFGARQCQQCGLVYTVHEPEEEQLHRDYHNSVNVLRFKGWIDEDIVAVCPDWSADGRIIRLTDQAPAARLLRLKEQMRIVDTELGCSSYTIPKTFVAFFAVRKQQIVGLCLVQPLERAHRFTQIDGIDYFSEETFDARCGVSRLWVSPLHRRRGIASKLLRAVQSHTVLGVEIPRDRIAFSTPTDDGRFLVRQFAQNDNFLVYQL